MYYLGKEMVFSRLKRKCVNKVGFRKIKTKTWCFFFFFIKRSRALIPELNKDTIDSSKILQPFDKQNKGPDISSIKQPKRTKIQCKLHQMGKTHTFS